MIFVIALIIGVGLLAGGAALFDGQLTFATALPLLKLSGGIVLAGAVMNVIGGALTRGRSRDDVLERRETGKGRYAAPRLLEERRDARGLVVSQIMAADTHEQATRHLQGTTIQGNRSIVATRIGRGLWDVHIENWDTAAKGKGMTRSENYDPDAWSEDYSSWKSRQPKRGRK